MNSNEHASLFFRPTEVAEGKAVVSAIWGFFEYCSSFLLSVVSNKVPLFVVSGAHEPTGQLTRTKTAAYGSDARTARPFAGRYMYGYLK